MNRRAWAVAVVFAAVALGLGFWLGQVLREPAARKARAPQPRLPGRNVLLIGLDGADWDIAQPLVAAGEMPHLGRLVGGGAWARLRTVMPPLSPVIWTSVATGKQPAKHGIFDFLAQGGDGSQVPVTSTLWRARSLWSILSDSGIPVAMTAWWATWPAEPVEGFLATDPIAYQLFRDVVSEPARSDPASEAGGKTWPAALYAEIRPFIVPPEAIADADLEPFVHFDALGVPDADDRERLDELKTVLASTRTYEAIAAHLLEKQPRGFHALYVEATDTAAHLFMPFHPPLRPQVDGRRFAAYRDVVRAMYREADALLGRMLERIGDDWNVIVLSDHGFRHGEDRPRTDPRVDKGPAADWHDRFGILVLHGPDVRAGVEIEDASVLDVAPTILGLYGLPVGQDMDGRVLEEALDPAFLERVAVRAIASYETGRPRALAGVLPSPQDAGLLAKLRALGYLGGGDAPAGEGGGGYAQATATAALNRGIALMAQGDLAGAEVAFEEALAGGAARMALVNLFQLHALRGDLERARGALARIERIAPDARELPRLRGVLADLEGDAPCAESLLREAVARDPADARAHVRLGHVLEQKGRLAEALAEYEAAIRADPSSAEAQNYRGNVLRLMGKPAEAEAAYRAAIEADPRYPGAYNNLGLVLQQQGRLAEATALYRKGLAQAPRSPLLHNSLAAASILERELDEAERHLRQALEIAPDMKEAHNNLGILLAERGRIEDALAAFEAALAADPDDAEAHFNRGKALLVLKRAEEAYRAFARAADLDPSHADAAIGAGELAFRAGRDADALRHFEQAARLTPDNPRLQERLAELRRRMGSSR